MKGEKKRKKERKTEKVGSFLLLHLHPPLLPSFSLTMSTSFRLDAVKALVDVLCGLERQREKDTERDSESSGLSGEKEQALLHRILKLLQQSAASSSSSSSSSSSGGGGERVLLSREQELVLGLCHYVAHSSSGGRHVVLPAILPYVEHLLDYSYHIDATSTRQEIIQVDRFSFGLSVRLLQAAALSHLAAKDIIPAILTLLASFPKRIAAAANGTFLSNVKMGKYKMLIRHLTSLLQIPTGWPQGSCLPSLDSSMQ